MQKKIEFNWEDIGFNTGRAKVIGGWLVLHYSSDIKNTKVYSESMIFVADRDHEWFPIPPFVEKAKEEKKEWTE